MSAAALHRNRDRLVRQLAAPALVNGDHLSLPEFERRYEEMPGDGKAELIEGIVIMSPPVSDFHGMANTLLARLLGQYAAMTPGLAARVNTSVQLDGKNEYQPDVMLRIESGKLARTRTGANGILEGRPEMVVEIALSSAAYDLHEKKTVYLRNQIMEYLIWELKDSRVHWFALENGDYIPLAPRRDGVTASRVFPGLWLDLPALLKGDEKKMFRVLAKGLKSPEHKSFVKKLAKS